MTVFRVSALYANRPGSRFDAAYYLGSHSDLAMRLLGPNGMTGLRVAIGEAALDGSPPAFWAISELIFTDRAAFDAAMAEHGSALFTDTRNYTDVDPVLQVSTLAPGQD